jgi:uncharacterized protein YacL
LGTLVYSFIGWELGVALARTTELNTDSVRYIVPATVICAALGYFLSPWIVIAPARAARNSLRQVPIGELLAGTVGLATGALIAALLTFPLSRLPPPFGNILPLITVIILGYLGAAVLVLRQADIWSLLRPNRSGKSALHLDGQSVAINSSPLLLLDTSVIIDGQRNHRRADCRYRPNRFSYGLYGSSAFCSE